MKIFPENKMLRNLHIVIYMLFALSVTILLVYVYQDFRCHHSFKFITKECKDLVINKSNYLKLRVSLEDYFKKQKSEGKLTSASVYFRDLNNGPVMGINENDTFSSASLLKLPIVMAVLDLAEENPKILDIQITNNAQNPTNIEQYFVPDKKIETNKPYSIKDIIERALVYSDNTAIQMLQYFMYSFKNNEDHKLLVFRELGLILPGDALDRDISTRAYSSLFRLLYNSSYLNKEYSELVLENLSKSYFKLGLRAGVPENIDVAHKFGERFTDEVKQLHDCGVIYYPENPYMLCIMTVGDNYDELAEIIKEVSRKVYEEVDSRKI